MKRPSFQFYPADWRKDAALQSCSIAGQGLWINIMCIAHECEPYGHLSVNGNPMSSAQLARLVGLSGKECAALLTELERAGVFSRKEDGCIYSRRMVKDERIRSIRADAGRLGGNPNLLGDKVKQKVNHTANHADNQSDKQNPTPSSSSSTSVKENTKTDKPGANAPVFPDDPCAKVFSDGVALLTACGDSERNARSYLGKLRKDHGDEAVLSALQRAKDGAVSDPKGFLAGALRPKGARLAL